jgi:hypothetical protein
VLEKFCFAPLAPQFWGEPDSSPPELGDLGGEDYEGVAESLYKDLHRQELEPVLAS